MLIQEHVAPMVSEVEGELSFEVRCRGCEVVVAVRSASPSPQEIPAALNWLWIVLKETPAIDRDVKRVLEGEAGERAVVWMLSRVFSGERIIRFGPPVWNAALGSYEFFVVCRA